MYRRKIVEVWEVQRWSWSEGWSAVTWCDSHGVALAVTMHELKPPSGWSWDTSTWEMQDETSCKPWCGWEYASTTKHFKRQRRWSAADRARRRRWRRVAIKACRVAVRKNSDETRIKDGLEQVQKTRRALTSKARLAGTQFDSDRVRASLEELARAGEDEAREVSRLLEAAPKANAVKLRRDLYKEVSAMADVLRSLPPPQSVVARRPQFVKSGTLSVGPSPPPSTVSIDDDARTEDSDAPEEVERKLRAVSEAAVMKNLMAERHDAIRDIHAAIHSINSLVRDLASQVETQQPLVDAVEVNTTTTKLAVQQANRQVVDAADADPNGACTVS